MNQRNEQGETSLVAILFGGAMILVTIATIAWLAFAFGQQQRADAVQHDTSQALSACGLTVPDAQQETFFVTTKRIAPGAGMMRNATGTMIEDSGHSVHVNVLVHGDTARVYKDTQDKPICVVHQ